jgi:hypothetical protein
VEAAAVEDDEEDDDLSSGAIGGTASARLVAVDMAQEGSSRAEVDAYLREELGLEETEAILDEAFGQGAADLTAEQRPGALDPSRITRLFARNRG